MDSRHLQIVLDLKDKASKELQGFQGKLQEMRPTFQKMAVAGTVAFAGVSALMTKTIKNASDLNESMNAVNVVFGEGAEVINEFGENSARAIGISTAEFNQMSAVTGALLKDVGKPMKEVAGLTNDLAVRASDLASVFNTDVSDAMSAINQAIRGETEAIRRYAGDVSDATLETYLMSQGIDKSVGELTQQEKRLYRVNLLLQQTSNVAGDFANTSGEVANQQRILQAEITNLSTKIGDLFLPIMKQVLSSISPVISKVSQWVEQNPELAKVIIIATVAITGLVAVIGALGLVMLAITPASLAVGVALAGIIFAIVQITRIIFALKNDWEAIWLGIQLSFAGVANGIVSMFESMINFIIESINYAIKAVNKLISALEKIPGAKKIGISQLSELSNVTLGRIDTDALINNSGLVAGQGGTTIINNINGGNFGTDAGEDIGNQIIEKLKLTNNL